MRPMTINQAAEHYKGSGLTKTAIRRALISSEITHVRVGKKYLVTLENIEQWLAGEVAVSKPEEAGIRRVEA